MSGFFDKVEQAAQFVKKHGKPAPKKKASPNVGQAIENVAQTIKQAGKTTTPKQNKRNKKVLADDTVKLRKQQVDRTNQQVEYALKEAVKKIKPKGPDPLEVLNPAKLSPAIDYLLHTPEGKKVVNKTVKLGGKAVGEGLGQLANAQRAGRGNGASPLAVAENSPVSLSKGVENYERGVGGALEKDAPRVLKKTVKSLPGLAASTFTAIPQIATDTLKKGPITETKDLAELTAKDYKRRYGSSAKKTKERLLKEGGASDLTDAASILVPTAAGAGRAISKGIRRVNPEASLVRERPVRIVEGVAHAQKRSPNAFTNVAENIADRVRAAKTKRVSGQGRDHKGNRKEASVSGAIAAQRGEGVVPIFEKHASRKLNASPVIKATSRATTARTTEKADAVNAIYRKPGKKLARYKLSEFDDKAATLLGSRGIRSAEQLNTPAVKQALTELRDRVMAKHAKGEVNRDINLEVLNKLIDTPDVLGKDVFNFMDSLEAVNAKTRAGVGADITNEVRKYVPLGHDLGLGDIRKTFQETLDKVAETRYKGKEVPSEVKQRLGEMIIDEVRTRAKDKGLADPIYVSGKKHDINVNEDVPVSTVDAFPTAKKSETPANLSDAATLNADPSIENTVRKTLQNIDKRSANVARDKAIEQFAIPELNVPRAERVDVLRNMGVGEKEAKKYIDGLPPTVARELKGLDNPPGKLGHALDLAMRTTSRGLLGTNPSWVIFQAIAAATGAAMTRTGPLSMWRATRWYKGLSRENQIKVDSFVGEGSLSDFTDLQGKKLSTEWKAIPGFQRLHDGWQNYKGTPFYAVGKWANPIRWTIEGNRKMETVIRRGLFYKEIKRQHWNNLVEGQGLISGNIDRFMKSMEDLKGTKDTNAIVTKYLDNEKFLESSAKKMEEWVGNYTAFSKTERDIIKRFTPFYGFLRYSLIFTLYTMPIKHPVVTSILTKLGQLNAEEQNELFGTRDLQAYQRAQLLWQTKQGGKKVVEGFNIGRANPTGNAALNLVPAPDENFQQTSMRIFSMLPPYMSNAIGTAAGVDPFTGKYNTYNGSTDITSHGNPSILDMAKSYIERTALDTNAPYSAVKAYEAPGRQSAESSLLFGVVPTKYAEGGDAAGYNAQAKKRSVDKGLEGNIAERVFGFPKVLGPVKPKKGAKSEPKARGPITFDDMGTKPKGDRISFGDTAPEPKANVAKPDKKKIAAVISQAIPSPPKPSKVAPAAQSSNYSAKKLDPVSQQVASASGSDTGTAVTINADEPKATTKDVGSAVAHTASIPTTVSVKTPKLNAKQKSNVAKALSVVDKKFPNATDEEKTIMLSVMSVEQNFNNDPSGDRDSEGAFQQRPSQGWGTPAQVNDLEHSVPKFMNKLIALRKSGLSPGEKAQRVQGSAFPDRYGQHMKLAKSVLASATGKSPSSGLDPAIANAVKDATTTSSPLSDTPKTKTDDVGAVIAAVQDGSKKPLSKKILDNLTSGEFTTQVAAAEPAKGKQLLKDKDISGLATTATNGPTGKVSVSGNANRPGVGLTDLEKKTLAGIAGLLPGGVKVGTGTNHNRMTTSGNVSDHWEGNAADLSATGAAGDKIATAALVYAGVSPNKARTMAKKGGLYNVVKNGVRYQIIWKTNIGGNHYDHVHVGVRKQ